jgi:hypothetical protein
MSALKGWVVVKSAADGHVVSSWAVKSSSAESDRILELVTGELSDRLEVAGAQKSVRVRGIAFERLNDHVRKSTSADEAIERLEKAVAAAGPETDPRDLAYASEVTTRYRLAKAAVGDMAGATRAAQAGAISNALAASAPYVNDQLEVLGSDGRPGPTGGTPPGGGRSATGARPAIEELPDEDGLLAAQLRQQLHAASDPVVKERIGYQLTLAQLRSFHRRTGV